MLVMRNRRQSDRAKVQVGCRRQREACPWLLCFDATTVGFFCVPTVKNEMAKRKREVDKIYRIELPSFQGFFAGSEPAAIISATCQEIRSSLDQAFTDDKDMVREHNALVESVLRSIH